MAPVHEVVAQDPLSGTSHPRLAERLDTGSFALYLARRALLSSESDPARATDFRSHLRTALATLATVDVLLGTDPAVTSAEARELSQPVGWPDRRPARARVRATLTG
jgi:hypothetical protein